MLSWVIAGAFAGAAVLLVGRGGAADRLRAVVPRPARAATGTSAPASPVVASVLGWAARWRRPPAVLDVADLAEQLAALSVAGLAWVRVWAALAESPGPARPACLRVARHVRAGGSASAALRAVDGPPELGWLAVACELAERAGAPVADVLLRFAAAVRADTSAAAEREAALAGPRATGALLSWLPLGGLGLGLVIGADPVAVLLGTGAGRTSLVAAAALWLVGRRWHRSLVRRAERAGT